MQTGWIFLIATASLVHWHCEQLQYTHPLGVGFCYTAVQVVLKGKKENPAI
jgi:hypothetical protein